MLGDYKVSRCTRKCFANDRPLREGEWYYSVVIEDESGEQLERRDYSADAWTEPPEGAIGWWKNRMPTADEKKLVLAPPEVLVDLLRQMDQFPDRAKSRYLLALMLMRKKIVRPANAADEDQKSKENILCLEVVANGEIIEIPVCEIGRSEADALRDELNELLYCEAEPDEHEVEIDD